MSVKRMLAEAEMSAHSGDYDITEESHDIIVDTYNYIHHSTCKTKRIKSNFVEMFFSLSLATYHALSSLIRNRHKFLFFGRAHYILPTGCFGTRPLFQDHKQKIFSREVEDVSMLLWPTSERRLFLDEIYNNFLDLTLVEQQHIFVDFFLKEFQDCLHRGLSSSNIINVNDVGRLHSLDLTKDPHAIFSLDGHFGILLLQPGEYSCDEASTQQLGSPISKPRLTTANAPSNSIAFLKSLASTSHDDFHNIHESLSSKFVDKVSILAPFRGNTYPLNNGTYHRNLPTGVCRRAMYPHKCPSAPAGHTFAIQRQTKRVMIPFCRRVGQCTSYLSTPVTIQVTKVSLATQRNCVSLIICKVNQPVEIRRGFAYKGRRHVSQQSLPMTLLLHPSQTTSNVQVVNLPQKLHNMKSSTSADQTNTFQTNLGPTSTYVANLSGKTPRFQKGSLGILKHTQSPTLAQKKKNTYINNNVKHQHLVFVSNQSLTSATPHCPVLPWANRALGGKAAAAPPSKPDFNQLNQRRDATATDNQHSMVTQPRTPGQHLSNLGAYAISANNSGHVNVTTTSNNPNGWFPTRNLGFFQPFEIKNGRQNRRNPAMGVISKHNSTCNNVVPDPQVATRGTVWNTSKPRQQRTNFNISSNHQSRQASSHHLLNSRTSNQVPATPLWNANKNFGWAQTQQAAGPGFLLWGAMIAKSLMKAVPKAVVNGPPVDSNDIHNEYNLPTSCTLIPWSDFEDVKDPRTHKAKTLGSGSFGIVKLMRQISSGKLCAVKINRDDVNKHTAIKNLKLEVEVLTSLKNLDCVPHLFGVTKPGTSQLPVVVQEFTGDQNTFKSVTLLFALQAKVLPPAKATRVALRICEAVKDIHNRKLLHCDLKADNILLEPNFVRKDDPKVTIIDFGLAIKMDDKPLYSCYARQDIPRVLKYCIQKAPEVVRGQKPFNVSSDVYSIGLIMQQLSCRSGGLLRKLGKACANKDYNMRPSLEDIIKTIKTHLASNQL